MCKDANPGLSVPYAISACQEPACHVRGRSSLGLSVPYMNARSRPVMSKDPNPGLSVPCMNEVSEAAIPLTVSQSHRKTSIVISHTAPMAYSKPQATPSEEGDSSLARGSDPNVAVLLGNQTQVFLCYSIADLLQEVITRDPISPSILQIKCSPKQTYRLATC